MLLYCSKELCFNPKGYNATYSRHEARFKHDHTFQAIDWVFGEFLATAGCHGCIDIGCGQGQVLEYVFDRAVKLQTNLDGATFLGIDISDVAIEQCQARCPHLGWIIDTYQGFLQTRLAREEYRGKVDLIVNKGGLTHVHGQSDYRSCLIGSRSLLCETGIYLYVQNKSFFSHWNRVQCHHWSVDIFDLMREIFGNIQVLHNNAYYIYAMGPGVPVGNGGRAAKRLRPRRIEFQFPDSGAECVRIGNDDVLFADIAYLLPNSQATGEASFPSAARLRRAQRERFERLVAYGTKVCVPGGPRVVLPPATLQRGQPCQKSIDIDLTDELTRATVLHFPLRLRHVRQICGALPEILQASPAAVVLNIGAEDAKIECATDLPFIDIDEFKYRYCWILGSCLRLGCMPFVVSEPPLHNLNVSASGWRADRRNYLAYMAVLRELCDQLGAQFVDLQLTLDEICGECGDPSEPRYAIGLRRLQSLGFAKKQRDLAHSAAQTIARAIRLHLAGPGTR